MVHLRGENNWVERPQHCRWGFEKPRPELLKISIDLRPKFHEQTKQAPLARSIDPDLSSILAENKKKSRASNSQQLAKAGGLFQKENRLPQSSSDPQQYHFFGGWEKEQAKDAYFGGPILDKSELRWRPTFHTRACGDVIGATDSGIPLPFNSNEIVKSVAAISGRSMGQSGIWIGPRLLLAALHIHDWIQKYPSREECHLMCQSRQTFHVESEISSQILSDFSPKLQLIHFSEQNDIGIYRLLDQYPPRLDWVRPEFLMERDEVYQQNLSGGRKVACVGFSGAVSQSDQRLIQEEAAMQLQKNLRQIAFSVETLDLQNAIKPQLRCFAPGTLDQAAAEDERAIFGVSCSLWKGSSGGPCVLLDGPNAGAIIGLVRGYDSISDPFNLVNGFPNGLKNLLKQL